MKLARSPSDLYNQKILIHHHTFAEIFSGSQIERCHPIGHKKKKQEIQKMGSPKQRLPSEGPYISHIGFLDSKKRNPMNIT